MTRIYGVYMNDQMKITAAVSGVLHYLRTEQEALAMSSTLATGRQPSLSADRGPSPAFKPWGISGRQEQMQVRNLMQMRTFKSVR
jgi:hypothetical protein